MNISEQAIIESGTPAESRDISRILEQQQQQMVPFRKKRLPMSASDNSFLVHKDLSHGNKLYLWNIAKIYDVKPMKRQKQEQYENLLTLQQIRGRILLLLYVFI
jgi:hypothetical protein